MKKKKTIFTLKKNNYFVCGLPDITCQTTGRCVRRPVLNETPVDVFIYMYFPIQAKMTRMRQRIGQRLKDSQNTYAMLTTFNEVDMR